MQKVNIVNIILHAHLPYVKHIEFPRFLEEDWLFESINESYLPLLRMLEKLSNQAVNYKLTMCFSPTLMTMLMDVDLQQRFLNYMERHCNLVNKEIDEPKLKIQKLIKWLITIMRRLSRTLKFTNNYNAIF